MVRQDFGVPPTERVIPPTQPAPPSFPPPSFAPAARAQYPAAPSFASPQPFHQAQPEYAEQPTFAPIPPAQPQAGGVDPRFLPGEGKRRRRGRRRGLGCFGSLILVLAALALLLFGLMFVRNSAGLRTRVQALPVVGRVLDNGLVNRVLYSDLLHRIRHADLADQINMDPAILQQVRDHGSLPAMPTANPNCPEPLILSAEWGNHDGGRSVAVEPSDCVRTSGLAIRDDVWATLVANVPETDVPGMRDQLICHMIGAQDKPTWNLEPWRPNVGLQSTILALCNP